MSEHYLRLNALLLSFNVDKHFSNCLDGLMLVDLTRSAPRILACYLTPEGVAKVRELAASRPAAPLTLHPGAASGSA